MGSGASSQITREKVLATEKQQPPVPLTRHIQKDASKISDAGDNKANVDKTPRKMGLTLRTESRLMHNEAHCNRLFKQPQHELSQEQLTRWCSSIRKDPLSENLYREYQSLLEAAGAQYSKLGTGFLPSDALVVVDMQNDFIPNSSAPDGGKFGVAEGATTVVPISKMARLAAEARSLIIATRDYHPMDHCSFVENSGSFPAHCVQGSKGARFYPPVRTVLSDLKQKGADVKVLFKGFHPGADSFGFVQYGEHYFSERRLGNDTPATATLNGSCALDWTGSFVLQCSSIEDDLDAPPDVLAVLSRKTGGDVLRESNVQRLIVCGLAFDYCVLDSALNAATAKGLAPGGVYIVIDATRAAHIPGVGKFGSGFLTDPALIVKKCKAAGVHLILSNNI